MEVGTRRYRGMNSTRGARTAIPGGLRINDKNDIYILLVRLIRLTLVELKLFELCLIALRLIELRLGEDARRSTVHVTRKLYWGNRELKGRHTIVLR